MYGLVLRLKYNGKFSLNLDIVQLKYRRIIRQSCEIMIVLLHKIMFH